MMIAGIAVRRRFFVTVGLLIIATGIWLLWSRATLPKINRNPPAQPVAFVRIVGAGVGGQDALLEEHAEYFDPTPLFLPTKRNFGQGPLPTGVVKQLGQVFRDFEPKWRFVESVPPEYGVTKDEGGGSLSEVLARGNDAPFAGLGAVDSTTKPLGQRKGYMEVKSLKSGLLSLSGELEGIDFFPVDYAPVDFVVAVASIGLVGDPVLITSSGQEDVDVKLKDYLVKTYRIGERLAPGRYVVSIGP